MPIDLRRFYFKMVTKKIADHNQAMEKQQKKMKANIPNIPRKK
tara:strand:- start:466 stop:594 length:129 start_codon:yes stop_codon:yes gene_type:complete